MSSTAPRPSRSNIGLTWLIRATGFIIALVAGLVALGSLVGGCVIIALSFKPSGFHGTSLAGIILFVLLMTVFYGIIAKVGYDMFRKINTTTLANFSFIFSFLVSWVLYHILPHGAFIGDARAEFNSGMAWAFLTFFILYYLIKSLLVRAFGFEFSKRGLFL